MEPLVGHVDVDCVISNAAANQYKVIVSHGIRRWHSALYGVVGVVSHE